MSENSRYRDCGKSVPAPVSYGQRIHSTCQLGSPALSPLQLANLEAWPLAPLALSPLYQSQGASGYTLKEIADFLSVHDAEVSQAVKRAGIKLSDCKT